MFTMHRFILWDEKTKQKQILPEPICRQYSYTLSNEGTSFTLPLNIKNLPIYGITIKNARLMIYRGATLVWQGLVGADETKVIIN